MRRPGYYRVRFANVDDQLLLWVNERLIPFDGPTTYRSPEDVVPRWSPEDPGDLTPVGVGSRQATLEVDRLRVLRDIYYLAVKADHYRQSEYEFPYAQALGSDQIAQIMADPRQWSSARLFGLRRTVEFRLEEDQFFPMGDNSPQSKDARLWSLVSPDGTYHDPPPFVERDLLIGKALLIYWPHAWRTPLDPRLPKRRFGPNMRLPLLPNLARIGLIR
jgi:signal peptidase I